MAEIDLSGKIAIVTGAGSGLGRAMTLGLAQAGCAVAGLDLNEEAAAKTAGEAKGAPGRVLPVACDVRRLDSVEAAVETCVSGLGGLTALVNCAGLGMSYIARDFARNPLRFWAIDIDKWQDVIDVNVRGTHLMARTVAPRLIERGWGRIVNVTTSFSTMIRTANMPYGQSKAALEAASVAWAGDLKDTGVTCNVLIPGGAADTPMVPPESAHDRSRLNKPEVMVAPVRWLCSELSDGVSGMRFIGNRWDPALPWQEAMKAAGAPAAWPELAAQAGAFPRTDRAG